MIITGSLEVNGEKHPFAPVYLTDSNGKLLVGANTGLTDSKGNFTLEVPSGMENQYVASDFFGGKDVMKIRAGKSHNLKITQSEELPEVTININDYKKPNIKNIVLISAAALVAVSATAFIIYRVRKS